MLEMPVTEGVWKLLDVQASSWKVSHIAENSVRDLKGSEIEVQLQNVLELGLMRNLPDVLELIDLPLYPCSVDGICVPEYG
jgi:hypothetical protein